MEIQRQTKRQCSHSQWNEMHEQQGFKEQKEEMLVITGPTELQTGTL